MEYYLCRAMEVCRLSEDQLNRLHTHEASERLVKNFNPALGTYEQIENRGQRCLMPYEIQARFNLPTLKEVYLIPEDDAAQSTHNQRLRGDMRKFDLVPIVDLSTLNVEKVHDFDFKVKKLNDELKLDFVYRGGKSKKQRISSDLD